jgi:hypothetical protein
MTRFKELRRIETAIENENEAELLWSLGYCQMKLKTANIVHTMRRQEKYWRGMEKRVRAALEQNRSVDRRGG